MTLLSTLTPDPPSQLDILGHDGNPLGMDGTKVSVLKQTHEVSLSSLLKSQHSVTLETQISLKHKNKPISNKTKQTQNPNNTN
jgi:hypothetical protein